MRRVGGGPGGERGVGCSGPRLGEEGNGRQRGGSLRGGGKRLGAPGRGCGRPATFQGNGAGGQTGPGPAACPLLGP